MVNFNWRIGGPAGSGIINVAGLFSKVCLRSGLKVFSYAEYPSLIRGGHNYLDVRVSEDDVYSHSRDVHLLVALDEKTIESHKASAVLCDETLKPKVSGECLALPLKQIAQKHGNVLYQNVVALGASLALIGLELDELNKLLEERFAKKGEEIVKANVFAAQDGWNYAKENFPTLAQLKREKEDRILLPGNDAIVCGAIKAGCKFLSAYPMTPATSILIGMAAHSHDYKIIVKHTEDEIASINMAIGANFAGVRGMTCTSGGGFALMAEGLGLAAQTETPVVIVESQRPGPGTGMATRSGQGDLHFMLNASTDEFPRVVITPGDVNECFYLTQQAFNIAEKYQMPVIILMDKFLSVAQSSVHKFDKQVEINRGKIVEGSENYLRYRLAEDGISPRTIPGTVQGEFVASSYEHNEKGAEDERAENRIAMHNKRFKKMQILASELPEPKLIGSGETIVLSWGSTKGVVREARRILLKKNKDFSHVNFSFLSPFPVSFMQKLKDKKLIVVEGNKTSQLSRLIREKTGITINHAVLKYDGRPFNPEDLSKQLEVLI